MSRKEGGNDHLRLVTFKSELDATKPATSAPSVGNLVDIVTNAHGRRALKALGQITSVTRPVVITVRDGAPAAHVYSAVTPTTDFYVIDRRPEDIAHLKVNTAAYGDPQLPGQLDRYYTIAVLARGIVEKSRALDPRLIKSPPTVGSEAINPGNPDRAREIGGWRVGAGVSLSTMFVRDTTSRQEMAEYLDDTLGATVAQARSDAAYRGLVEGRTRPPRRAVVPDSVIGLCNPLGGIELKQVIAPIRQA